jgi:hypothetical protein
MWDPRVFRGNTYSRPVELRELSFIHEPPRKGVPTFLSPMDKKDAAHKKPRTLPPLKRSLYLIKFYLFIFCLFNIFLEKSGFFNFLLLFFLIML